MSRGLVVLSVIVIFALPFFTSYSSAQINATNLIEQMIEAQGGRDRLSGIRNSVKEGRIDLVSQGGIAGDAKLVIMPPERFLMVLAFDDADTLKRGLDGDVAWQDYPPGGGLQQLSGGAVTELKRTALGFGDLLDPERYGIKYIYQGEQSEEGIRCHLLEKAYLDGSRSTLYVDATTFLVRKVVEGAESDQSPARSETRYSDYRESQGITQPHREASYENGQEETIWTYNSIAYDVAIDVEAFRMHERRFTHSELIADARELSDLIENTHPAPYHIIGGRIPYHRHFQHVLHAIPDEGMTAREFTTLLRPFVAAIGDAHTNVYVYNVTSERSPGGIPLRFKAVGSSLVVTGVPGEEYENLLGTTLVAVEGVNFDELGVRLAKLKPIENRYHGLWHFTSSYLWYEQYLRELIPDWRDSSRLRVTLRQPAGDTVEIEFGLPVDVSTMIGAESRFAPPEPDASGMVFDFRGPDGKTAFLRIDHMKHYRERSEVLVSMGRESLTEEELQAIPSATEFFRSLTTAMKEVDAESLIVDLRRNDGGDAMMTDILLYFLYGKEATQATRVNTITRVSERYLETRDNVTLESLNSTRSVDLVAGDYDFSEDYTSEVLSQGFSLNEAFANRPTFLAEWISGKYEKHYCPDRILVITSPETFSAGFLVALRMYRAGATLVGTPPGQATNSAGNIIGWSLANTGVGGWVSQSFALNFPEECEIGRELPVQYPLTLEILRHYDFDPNAEILYAMDLLNDSARKVIFNQ